MDRVVAHAIVGVAAAAAVQKAMPRGGPGAAAVGAMVAMAFHEKFDAPLASWLRAAGL